MLLKLTKQLQKVAFAKQLQKVNDIIKPLPLGRWATKTGLSQLTADVHDPGYDQMHWSVYPAGKARQQAIQDHYRELDRKLSDHQNT